MTINRTTLLDLPLPVTGTESGVWGDVVNNGLSQYIDISVAGSLSLSADSDTNLSSTEGDASATNIGSTTAQYAILRCTGARTTTRNINAPAWAISGGTLTNYSKIYIVVNETTGSQNIVLRATNSATPTYTTGVTIVPGERAVCAWNGSDFVKVGGAAGGSTTQIQFNNAGVFGGSANLTWDGTNVQIGATGALRLADTDSSNYVAFKSPGTVASNVTWTLPSADGTNGQALTTNGSGTLAFSSVTTSPGGSTTQVQYNNAGAFAGSANFTFDGTNIAVASRTFGRGAATSGGANNVAAGQNALSSNTTGEFSIAMGYNALTAQTTGSSNTGLGNAALAAVISGNNNTGVGRNAFANTTASDNTGVGYLAGINTTTGANNTAVGSGALQSNTTGASNVAVGYQALDANTTGSENTALGYDALGVSQTVSGNTAIGTRALQANTTGTSNVAVGAASLQSNTTGSFNAAFGANIVGVETGALGTNTTGSYNTALGVSALKSNTTASNNAALGYQALYSNTTGYSNTGIGESALRTTSTGAGNTAVGSGAMYSNTTASINAAVGFNALYANTTGASNVAFGCDTARKNTTGSYNTAIGQAALYENTTADANTAMGYQALYSNTTGTNNAAIGYQAGYSCTTGIRNTFLGTAAGNGGFGAGAFTTGQYNISIGYTTGASSGIRNNSIVIGTPYAVVDKGENTGFITPNGGGVYQGNNSSSWSTTSDQRLKKNIVDNTEGLDKITQIRVRNFEYRTADEVTELPAHAVIKKEGIQLGVIAQELQQVCPDCVKEESTGVLSVDSDNVFWHMVNAIKELKTELDSVKAELATLKGA